MNTKLSKKAISSNEIYALLSAFFNGFYQSIIMPLEAIFYDDAHYIVSKQGQKVLKNNTKKI